MNLRREGCIRSAQYQTEIRNHLRICLKTEENQGQDGRSQVLPVVRWLLANSPESNEEGEIA
jgi:hypothetical protein